TLSFGGNIDRTVTVPPGTTVALSQLAAHRNPNYWPHGLPAEPDDPWHPRSNLDNDLEEFKPGRWIRSSTSVSTNKEASADDDETDTPDLFRPLRATYFPD